MSESAAYTYRLTEDGDLILGGTIPEYESQELYPHYVHRDGVLRVVALPGVRIPACALAGYPNLRVAVLSEAVSIGAEAFRGCPLLSAVQLSPRTVQVAPGAFLDCPQLFCIDYAGKRAELEALLRPALPATDSLLIRTLPDGGEIAHLGKIGDAEWTLDTAGVMTVFGGDVPDLARAEQAPYYPYLESIRHLVIGEGVTRVGEHAFSAMPALAALTVVSATDIADFAFSSCHALRRIDLFASVKRLGLCSLAGVGVQELMLPASLRVIPDGLLQSAFALRTLVLPLLPATAQAPFLEECGALETIKLLAASCDARAVNAALCLPKRTRITCFLPLSDGGKEIDKAFLEAERAIRRATASYAAARAAQDAPRAHVPRIPPLIEEAEQGYLSLERFRFEPDGTVDPALERLPYKKRARILKQRAKDRGEELASYEGRAERGCKHLLDRFSAFAADLGRAAEAAACEERDVAAAVKEIEAAEAAIVGQYPLDRPFRDRAAALRANLAALAAEMPYDIMPNAAKAVSEYKLLIDYRRFDDLRDALGRAVLLLDEYRTESGEKKAEEGRLPPTILVAGGDPAVDKTTAACIAALRRAGAAAEWVRPNERHLGDQSYDALLLCDGEPSGEVFGGFSHGLRINERRARRDSTLFSAFFLYGKPIMGIGRGAQQINLYLGGTMRWNLAPSERELHEGKDGRAAAHGITVTPDNALSETYGLGGIPMRVLSDHSSVIRTLGRELVPIAKARDGAVEAFVHRRVPLIGVQFALDRMLTDAPKGFVYPAPAADDGMPLFKSFVELACRVREKPPVEGTEGRYTKPRRR